MSYTDIFLFSLFVKLVQLVVLFFFNYELRLSTVVPC